MSSLVNAHLLPPPGGGGGGGPEGESAVIVLYVHRRPQYFKQVLDVLRAPFEEEDTCHMRRRIGAGPAKAR